MALFNMIVNYACALIWLYRGLENHSIPDYVIALIFLSVGVVHTFRYVKQKLIEKEL